MSLDTATVRRIASLARLRMDDGEVLRMQAELNGILGWVEQLQAVPTEGVPPMAGGNPLAMAGAGAVALRLRDDIVTDGNIADAVLANAPDRERDYFGVPKVVE